MTPFHLRKSQERIVALCLALVDPIASLLAGLWLATKLRPVIDSWFHPNILHYFAWAVVLYVGWTLIASSLMTPLSLLMRGFGFSEELFRKTKPKQFTFWIGLALIIISHDASAMHWLDERDPLPNYTGTLLLGSVDAIVLALGAYEFICAGYRAATASIFSWSIQSKNRSRFGDLSCELALCGGVALGIFRERNVAHGAPRNGEVLLYGERSANRGTLVMGGPGSSKTRSKIYPDFYWGLRTSPRAGALVFVTKKRSTDDFHKIAGWFRPKEQIHVVGIGRGRSTMDITTGMTHESIGDAIKDGLGEVHSEFWKQGPSALVEGLVELIHALRPATIHVPAAGDKDDAAEPGGDAYDLELGDTLPTLILLMSLDGRMLDAVFDHGFRQAMTLDDTCPGEGAALRGLLREIKERLVPLLLRDAKLGEELRQSALPQLQPFGRGVLRAAFCDRHGIDLALIEKGHVILVEIDETEYPRAVNTVVRMLFRRIVQMARERTASHRVGQLDPILLVCDEYGNYASPGHVQAWNTIRESNFVATVGITSVSALVKQLGDQHAANAIVANFANKFFFEVDDKATRDVAGELIGKTTVVRRGTSEGTSKTRGTSANGSAGDGSHRSNGTSRTESMSEHLEDALDSAIWRGLGAERDCATAIAFVRTAAGVATDVVTLGVLDPGEAITTALPEDYGVR